MIPTLVVLAGYFVAELFLSGFAAAAAVAALGTGEYIWLWIFRKKNHPSILIEAAVLAGVVIAGDLFSGAGFPGAGYVILEMILGGVLLFTGLSGKPWLHRQMLRVAGLSAGRVQAREVSMLMGILFLLHGIGVGILIISGTGSVLLPALASFLVLYLCVMFFLRRRLRRLAGEGSPSLTESDDGLTSLLIGGEIICTMVMEKGGIAGVSDLRVSPSWQIHQCLDHLEAALRTEGYRGVRFVSWEPDTLPLEMSGYTDTPSGWLKMLLIR